MFLRVESIPNKILVGKRINMSLSADRTVELWQNFMPKRKSIPHTLSTDLFCVQVYAQGANAGVFDPNRLFDKWATIEVEKIETLPDELEVFELSGGLYAVFLHQGAAATGAATYTYIFTQWLPTSSYELDNRPHFEILGEKYKNNQPDSEEEIWIPIRLKTV